MKQARMNKVIAGLYSISGIGSASGPVQVTVDKNDAETNFLVLVNLNCFGLKTMMTENMDITNGPVKDYYRENNFDFERLLRMLQA